MRAVSSDGAVGAQFGDQVPLGNDKVALAAPGSRPWGVRPGSAGVRGSGVEGSLSAAVTQSVLVSSSPLGIWPHSRPSVLQTPSSGSLPEPHCYPGTLTLWLRVATRKVQIPG